MLVGLKLEETGAVGHSEMEMVLKRGAVVSDMVEMVLRVLQEPR